jgi:hypothetical protein
MNHYEAPTEESDGIEIEPRTERALSEPLSVVSLDGTPVESTDETTVDSRVLAGVDVDEQLGANAPGPQVATSDGGIIEAGDDGEILDEQDPDDNRPDDCDCSPLFDDLPCWPCYRDGFEEPNPDADDE